MFRIVNSGTVVLFAERVEELKYTDQSHAAVRRILTRNLLHNDPAPLLLGLRTLTPLAFSFSVTTTNSTATDGEDYVGVSGTLVAFAQGEATRTLDIDIINDGAEEGEESFLVDLKLHGPSRPSAALGSRTQMTVIIQDNDGVNPTTSQGL